MSFDSKKLGNVCLVVNRGISPSYTEKEGIMIFNQKCVRNGRVSSDEARRTDPTKKRIPEDRYLAKLDILVNSTGVGTLGRVGQVKDIREISTIDSHVTLVRANHKIVEPLFLGYALRFCQPDIELLAEGSTGQTELSRERLRDLSIPFPPIPEQRAIAGILGALDDKIEVNRRMNATLESMARTVFRQWFVVNEEVKSWEIQTLQQHIEAEKGLSYKGEGLSKDGGTPMHNLNSVYEGGSYKYEGIKYYTGEYRDRHILRAGDIIVTNTEQGFEYLLIGFPAIVPKHFGNTGIFTHHIFRVRPLPTSPVKTHYLFFLLMSPYVRDQIIGCTNGTTVNMLSADGLRTPKFHLPPKQLIDKFEQFAAPIFEKMELIHEESRTLASLRDSLLPKLMRGEVRVVNGLERMNG